jgi:hypothetical protein
MIRVMENMPGNVIGLEAQGKVTREDYEATILPQIEAKQREFDKIRLMYVLGDDFEGYSAGATWEDAGLAFKRPGTWERIAVVSDSEMLRKAMGLFAWMVPGEVKVYELAESNEARDWVTAA